MIVTVRKRLEAAQTVPVAVSAFSADALERAKIGGAADLQFSIPNAVLTGNDRFTIRGIGNASLGGDNGVGLAVNGATIGYIPYDDLFDMDRVEVLRGPQGTLFGRNTTGGALSVFTKRPTSELGGNLSLELGNFNQRRAVGMVNIPITDDLRQRFAGYVQKRDGFTRNEATGRRVDGRDQYSVRSSTRLLLGDNTEANLMLALYDENSSRTREAKRQCKADPVLGCSPNDLGFDSPDYNATIFKTLANAVLSPAGLVKPGSNIYTGAPNPTDLRAVAADFDATFRLKQRSATFELSHEFDPVTLTYIGGYSKSSTEQNTDWDNAALPFRFAKPVTYSMSRNVTVTTDQLLTTDSSTGESKTTSHEVRLASKGKGFFTYTTGLFHYQSEGSSGFFIWHPFFELFQKALGRPAETWFINGETLKSTTRASAWFGEGQLNFSNDLRATLGARYSTEKRDTLSRNIVLTASQPFTQKPTIDASSWTGRASLDYRISKDAMLFGTVATGYKGGGFNAGNAKNPTFEPETVTAYELGLKSEWLGGTLRTNASLFYNDYKNMQLAQRISGSAIASNANATTSGAELELLFAPTRSWLLDANFSLLNTKLGSFVTVDAANPGQSLTSKTPEVAVNLAGNKLPSAPETKIKLGAQYTTGLFDTGWTMTSRFDYVWQDKYFAREFNTPTDVIGAWGVTNLQLRFANSKGTIQVKAYVKNLSDASNVTSITIEDALIGSYRNVRLLDPRTFGVQVEYKF
ncbi:TonB-dependent receptor [Roseateles toxinivorans]|uniref:TonB-dependent receptor n=1 Tax=Roseateles toxinivorans TaxID=270368 RepID=UPI001FB57CCC|nr:TonB-dependent receptor [Roseateles toxinivorans]